MPNSARNTAVCFFSIESPDQSLMSRHRLKEAQREFYSRLNGLGGMNVRKIPFLAQKELLEQNAAKQLFPHPNG